MGCKSWLSRMSPDAQVESLSVPCFQVVWGKLKVELANFPNIQRVTGQKPSGGRWVSAEQISQLNDKITKEMSEAQIREAEKQFETWTPKSE